MYIYSIQRVDSLQRCSLWWTEPSFLYFHTAIRILLSSSSTEDEIDYANKCLKYFSYQLRYFSNYSCHQKSFPHRKWKFFIRRAVQVFTKTRNLVTVRFGKKIFDQMQQKCFGQWPNKALKKIIGFEHPFISDSTSFLPNIKVF